MEGAVLPGEDEPAATRRTERGDCSSREAAPLRPDRRVLVLNRNWQAVGIIGVRRAFNLLFREHARIISPECSGTATFDIWEWIDYSLCHPPVMETDGVRTVRLLLRIPDVVILSDFDRLPIREVRLSRETVFERDGHTCQYCGKKFHVDELSIDHVIPRERGGRNTWENLVTACKSCNAKKANRLPHEAGMRLQHKPRRPPRLPFAATTLYEQGMDPQWKSFLPSMDAPVTQAANQE
jgi:5-methylcytosine-specific restriction endonuclease McrA